MSSETHPGKWKAYPSSQTFGTFYDGSSLPFRTAQIKVPKPYLLQGEVSTAQHIPPTISCPSPRGAAHHPYLQQLTVLPWMGSPIETAPSPGVILQGPQLASTHPWPGLV